MLNNASNDSWMITPSNPDAIPLISGEMKEILENVSSALAFGFGVLGVVTNAINIRVFIGQGVFSDSNTISLFCLAIADFVGCLSAIPAALCQVIRYEGTLPVFFSCYFITILIFSILHVVTTRLTCWITVYISVERSLCVLIPFKVKALIRPKVTAMVMIILYSVIVGSYIPYYSSARIVYTFNTQLNASMATLAEGKLGRESTYYLSFIYNTILSNIAFGIVLITTNLMVYKLKVSRKWRQSAMTDAGNNVASINKNTQGDVEGTLTDQPVKEKENSQGKRELEVMKIVTLVTALLCLQ